MFCCSILSFSRWVKSLSAGVIDFPRPALVLLLLSSLYPATVIGDEAESVDQCIQAIRTENFNLAEQICLKQLSLAKHTNDQSSVLALYIALMDTYKNLDNNQQFDKFEQLAANHPLFNLSPAKEYQWLRLKAIKLHHAKKLSQSNQLFSQALKIALDLNDPIKISNSNIDLGISAAARGDLKASLNHYRTSLDLTRELNDPYATGLSLKSVGAVYMKLEEYQQAIEYFTEALIKYEEHTQVDFYDQRVHNRIATVYEYLVDAHQKLNNQSAAQHFLEQLNRSNAKISNDHDRANQLVQQAEQLVDLENYSAATKKLRQALTLFHGIGVNNPTEVYYQLALVYQKAKHDDLAKSYALEGLGSQNPIQSNQPVVSKIYLLLSQLYTHEDPRKALDFAIKHNQARETFLQAKYDTDLKTIQHQIELEKNQNKLVSSQLENFKQKAEIQTLNNRYLRSLLILLCLLVAIVYLYVKKKRQQADLKASINYHKNQLAVLSLANVPQPPSEGGQQNKFTQQDVNEMLVKMMLDATHLWTKTTGESLVEMADQSKIWTITNDNGTLRTRSLEKYLSIQKMPTNPRWRNVVRTCHFVLAEPTLSESERHEFNQKLENLIQVIKEFYGSTVK